MFIKKTLILITLAISFLFFQNCGNHAYNTIEQPFDVVLDEANIVSEIHTLNLPNDVGLSKMYMRKASDNSNALALEIVTHDGLFISYEDYRGTLDDFKNFKPIVISGESDTRLAVLNDSRAKVVEVSFNNDSTSLRMDYQANLIHSLGADASVFATVGYEESDRFLNIGLNKILFENFMISSFSVLPRVTCADNFTDDGRRCVQTQMTCSNGVGRGLRSFVGNSYGECIINKCMPGFVFENGSCYPELVSCTNNNRAAGVRRYTSNGNYSACEYQNCGQGFIENYSGVCVPLREACNSQIANGKGLRSFDYEARRLGACTITSCESGFVNVNNSCVESEQACELDNAVSAFNIFNISRNRYEGCRATECESGYIVTSEGTCASTRLDCTDEISNASDAFKVYRESTGYGACTVSSCDDGYTRNNQRTVCYLTSRSCDIENGEGERIDDSNECTVVGCNNGYTQNNATNSCDRNGGSSTGGGSSSGGNSGGNSGSGPAEGSVCSVPNGSGVIDYSNFIGAVYSNGACNVTSCDDGYVEHQFENRCLPRYDYNCRDIPNGRARKTYNVNTFLYGSCQVYTCDPGYQNQGFRCRSDNEGDR